MVESSIWLIAAGIPAIIFLFLMGYELMILVRGGLDENGEPEQNLDSRQMIGITAVFLVLMIALNLFGAMTSEIYGTEKLVKSMSRNRLYYEWSDVDCYSFEASGGGLEMEIVMNDGRSMTCGNSWFVLSNDAFSEQFPDDVYDYIPWLAETIGPWKLADDFDWESLRQEVGEDYLMETVDKLETICEG